MKVSYFSILLFVFAVNLSYTAVISNDTLMIVKSEPIEKLVKPCDDFELQLQAYCLLWVILTVNRSTWTEGILTCRQSDPDLNQCIKNSINQQLPNLHKGSKVLNILPLDPLRISDGRYEYSSGSVGGTIILKGVNVYGISKSLVTKVETRILNNGLISTIKTYFPRILVEGSYKADVKINELKMRPKGYFNLTLSEMSITTKTIGDFETKKEKKHLILKKFDIEPEIGQLKIYATGLFADPAFNNIVLDYANQYWPEIVRTILPQTRSTWEPIVLDAANKFLSAVPFEKLLIKDFEN